MRKLFYRSSTVMLTLIAIGVLGVLFSPKALAVDKNCHRDTDSVYAPGAQPIDVWYDGNVPRWIQGCFQRIVDQQHAESPDPIAISFIYLTPESYTPAAGQTTINTTAKALFYYSYPRDGANPGYPSWMEMGLNVTSTNPNVIGWRGNTDCANAWNFANSPYCFGFFSLKFGETGQVGHNRHWISSETVSLNVGALPVGGSNICYNMTGFFHPEGRASSSDTGNNCIYVYKYPPAQTTGDLTVTKYGSWQNNNVCIRKDPITNPQKSPVACSTGEQVKADDTDASVRYNVQANSTNSGVELVGYRLNYYDGNGLHSCHVGDFPGAVDTGLNGLYGLLCFNANLAGRTFSNIFVSAGRDTFLDLYYKVTDPPANGSLDNIKYNCTTKKFVANGWAFDRSNLNSKIDVAFWKGTAAGPTTNLNFSTTANGNGRAGEVYDGISINGHLFSTELPDTATAGQPYIYAYALGITAFGIKNGDNPFIGKRQITQALIDQANCPPPEKYPWLQTIYGDVSAANFVSGQQYNKPGSRLATSAEKEATNVIMATTADQQFCSVNLYALGTSGKTSREQCRNGGYSENQRFSDINTAINNAWNQNGKGNSPSCNPRYGTQNLSSTIKVGTTLSLCNNGTIYQVVGNSNLSSLMVGQPSIGRATIWVKGNLTIDRDVAYNYLSTGYSAAENIPNLAIYVEGEVVIKSNVSQLDAAIISTGDIETCEDNYIASAANCGLQLVVHGMLFGNEGYRFGRNYFNEASPNTNPAEKIVLTGQSIVFPPPGLDKASLGNNDLKITEEDNPRLK